ncbi:MAG: hypothetical protein HY059_22825 [Proteobacteria bacterium]|nr:hypothetical protein [Pseudomonadota bacterium]
MKTYVLVLVLSGTAARGDAPSGPVVPDPTAVRGFQENLSQHQRCFVLAQGRTDEDIAKRTAHVDNIAFHGQTLPVFTIGAGRGERFMFDARQGGSAAYVLSAEHRTRLESYLTQPRGKSTGGTVRNLWQASPSRKEPGKDDVVGAELHSDGPAVPLDKPNTGDGFAEYIGHNGVRLPPAVETPDAAAVEMNNRILGCLSEG